MPQFTESLCSVSCAPQDSYTAILMEDAGRGETVITLRVRDRDSRDGGAGELTFMIDAVAFILERSYVADGWWELAVKTETVSLHTCTMHTCSPLREYCTCLILLRLLTMRVASDPMNWRSRPEIFSVHH